MLASYPEARADWIDIEVIEQMKALQDLITAVRTARAENNIDPRKRLPIRLLCQDGRQQLLQSQQHHLQNLAQLSHVEYVSRLEREGLQVHGVCRLGEFALILDNAVDIEAERSRLGRAMQRVQKEVEALENKLKNEDFLRKAPGHVVETTRERYHEAVDRLGKLQEKLDGLSQS